MVAMNWLRTQESNLVSVAYEASPPSPAAPRSPRVESNHRLRFRRPDAVLQQGVKMHERWSRERESHPLPVGCNHRSELSVRDIIDTHGADDANRTRLNHVGNVMPHQSASSAEHNTRAGTGNRTRTARFGRPAPHLENVRMQVSSTSWTCRESHPQTLLARQSRDLSHKPENVTLVELTGIEPVFADCQPDVFPLDDSPMLLFTRIELAPPKGIEPSSLHRQWSSHTSSFRRQHGIQI